MHEAMEWLAIAFTLGACILGAALGYWVASDLRRIWIEAKELANDPMYRYHRQAIADIQWSHRRRKAIWDRRKG